MGIIERLLKFLLPYKEVVKNGEVYLRRHYLSPRTWRWRLFLHLINKPDDDRDPHDHPWDFWTIILRGGYTELFLDPQTGNDHIREARPGKYLFRKAEHTHRITKHHKGLSWTLLLVGPTRRRWGFHTEDGWVDHTPYKLATGEALEADEWAEDKVPDDRRRHQAQSTNRT